MVPPALLGRPTVLGRISASTLDVTAQFASRAYRGLEPAFSYSAGCASAAAKVESWWIAARCDTASRFSLPLEES